MSKPTQLKILAVMSVAGVAFLLIAWKMGFLEQLIGIKDIVLLWCRANPTILFIAIIILPGFAFPVAPLLILAGVVWGSNPLSCSIALTAVLLNIAWSHLLAAGPARGYITALLGKRWERWKNIPPTDHWRLTCLLRVTPGVPLFVQNYLIGMLGIPLRFSLAVAVPITGLYACGFVLTGGAIFEGRIGLLIVGLSLLVAAGLALKTLHRRLALRSQSVGNTKI